MTPRLSRLIDEILAFVWSTQPVLATSLGVHEHDHRLVDADPQAIAWRGRELADRRSALARALGEETGLPPDEALDARLLDDLLAVEGRLLEEVRAPFRDPAFYLDEILYGIYYLAQRDFAPLPARVETMISRLREGPRLLRQGRSNLSDGATIPHAWVEAALRQVPGSLLFLERLERDLAPRAAAQEAALRAALVEARRAVEAFEVHLRAAVLPAASGDLAVGRPLFDFLLRAYHGLGIDADTLHDLGRNHLTATEERLREAARRLDPRRSWQELVASFKADHPPRDRFLDDYHREVDRARAFVRERGLLTLPEGERLHVIETPSFQRSLCPMAAYLGPAAFEPVQDGLFWVTPPEDDATPERQLESLQDHPRPSIPVTTAHEAYPGHHVQISRANRVPSRVRRTLSSPAFVEGWGFYCEQLMGEEGFYADPRTHLMQLKDELWRACRVIIDVGLQTRGMTVEEAAGILTGVARLEAPSARGEVLRYARAATQPMSYTAGKHEILNLREEYRRLRGAGFRLLEFHDLLLSYGSIPLSAIRERLLADAAPRGG